MAGTIITVAQQKGGAGKTTLTAHLAVAFKDAGKSVALVDIDPQQSLSNWFRLRQELYEDAEDGMVLSRTEGWRSRSEVDKLARDFDIVMVDTPPHAETETRVAVRGAQIAVVPCQPSPMDVWATYPVLELARKEKAEKHQQAGTAAEPRAAAEAVPVKKDAPKDEPAAQAGGNDPS